MSAAWSDAEHSYDPEFEDVPEKAPLRDLPTERLAVVSLVAGIAGFFLPIVGPVTAIVSGHVARDEIRKARGRLGGDGLARTGLVLGYVWMGFTVLAIGAMATFTYTLTRSATPETVTIRAEGVLHEVPRVYHEVPRIEQIERIDGSRLLLKRADPASFPKTTVRIYREGPPDGSAVIPPLPPMPPLPPAGPPDAT